MDEGSAGLHRRHRVQDEGQDLPIDLYEPQGLLGYPLALRGDRHSDLVAHPAGIVPEDATIAEGPPHHLAIADRVDPVGPSGVGLLERRDIRSL